MNSPKEKAKELVEEFDETLTYLESKQKAKACALVCVRELLRNDYTERSFVWSDKDAIHHCLYREYWTDVLIEISKL